MKSLILATGFVSIFCSALLASDAPNETITFVDLQPKANHKLTDTYPSKRYEDNDLRDLPRGKQTLEKVPFMVGESFIVLGSKRLPTMPEKVKGIVVGAKANTMYILHGSCYNTVPDDTLVGKYVVNFDDKSQETIELVYGKDYRDWWALNGDQPVTRGTIAWTGTNKTVAERGASLRLFMLTWKNPKPEKRIATLDYISTQTDNAPFCVAITLDRK